MGQLPTLDRTNTHVGNQMVPRDVTPETASILKLEATGSLWQS